MTNKGFAPDIYTRVISMRSLIEYDCKMCGCARISLYEILDLFVVIKCTLTSRNIILYYTSVIHYKYYVQYRYKRKRHDHYHRKVISNHMTFSSLSGDVFLDTTHYL